jgi:Holliday junction resolvasome RuvABC DNA-binding subunit
VAAAGVAASTAAMSGGVASEGEIVGALQALGYSLGEARQASRAALADTGVNSTLEERVKAALRSLLRE